MERTERQQGLPGSGRRAEAERGRAGRRGARCPASCEGGGEAGGSDERGSHGNRDGSPNTASASAGSPRRASSGPHAASGETEQRALLTRAPALQEENPQRERPQPYEGGAWGERKIA